MKFIAVDFETANSNRQSACSIGIAVVENMEIIETFHRLIKPTPNYYNSINTSIHGLTKGDTDNSPTFDELWPELQQYFDGQVVVAHNASFDFSVLRYLLNEYGIEYPKFEYACTVQLSKRVYPGMFNYRLSTMCDEIGFDLNHHDAESDAEGCARLMIEIMKDSEVSNFSQLCEHLGCKLGTIGNGTYKSFSSKKSAPRKNTKAPEIIGASSKFEEDHSFFGKKVVFTGTLERMTRAEARQMVADLGGDVKSDSLSTTTNFLVLGQQDFTKFGDGYKSSKVKKAEKFISEGKDIEIISEGDFYGMV